MSELNPDKLHIRSQISTGESAPTFPRCYTLTHSDRTGDLFLTIGPEIDRAQISGWYTRLMRDEVLACWEMEDERWTLHVYLHVSGGLILGTAKWRDSIFRKHLKQVLQTFRYGDSSLFSQIPELDDAPIMVHFQAPGTELDRVEDWGNLGDYVITMSAE